MREFFGSHVRVRVNRVNLYSADRRVYFLYLRDGWMRSFSAIMMDIGQWIVFDGVLP